MKTNNCNIKCNTGCGGMPCPSPCSQRLNRRDFLKMALAAGLAAGCGPLAGCSPAPPTPVPTATPPPTPTVYWPADSWRASTPEQQGIDSEKLVTMLQFVVDQGYALHSLLVIRNGYAALEAYFSPFQPNTKDDLICVSRSFVSALMGIAIEQGHIAGTDQKMMDFFPGMSLANDDLRKNDITLEHLLTNRSGLRVGTIDDEESQIQQILDSPLGGDPGTSFGFGYEPYILSVILPKAVGTDSLSFAREHLFEPLGISDVSWDSDADGVYIPTGMQMTPRDIAKLGYLYLKNGVWKGERIVPAEWIAASLQAYGNTGCGLGFGYQWWIYGFGAYAARSFRSQCCVVPDADLVVVANQEPGVGAAAIEALVEYFVTPAAVSAEPLPENPEAAAQLESLIEQVGGPPES